MAKPGLAWLGLAWPGLAWPRLMARPGWPGRASPGRGDLAWVWIGWATPTKNALFVKNVDLGVF